MKKTPIPCPLCGKRLFDFQGEACPNNFELSIKCRNKNCRIVVKIGAKYIERQIASAAQRRLLFNVQKQTNATKPSDVFININDKKI